MSKEGAQTEHDEPRNHREDSGHDDRRSEIHRQNNSEVEEIEEVRLDTSVYPTYVLCAPRDDTAHRRNIQPPAILHSATVTDIKVNSKAPERRRKYASHQFLINNPGGHHASKDIEDVRQTV